MLDMSECQNVEHVKMIGCGILAPTTAPASALPIVGIGIVILGVNKRAHT